jgi:DNA polymerase I
MYRAYWAIPRTLKTTSGEQTNAVFGVATMFLTMLRTEEPDAVVFAFDAGSETFRHQEHTEYKEGRAETPDDFYVQIPRIRQLIDTMHIPSVEDPKYEADDFLCAYATAAEKAGYRVTIVTGDRDAFQLATKNIRIAIPHKGYQAPEYLGPDEIYAKYGIRPDQVASYKGLCGDPSDNLPGVHGIGPKGAATLLQAYDTLENIYAHLDDIKPTVRAKLEKDRESAFFCERMAQLICDIPLPIPLEELTLSGIPMGEVTTLLQELQFQSLAARLRSFVAQPYGQRIFTGGEALSTPAVTKAEPPQLSLF